MRILLDEGLPLRTAALLRDQGVDAVHVTEMSEAGAADASILEEAKRTDRVVITLDADFHALLALRGWEKPSVIRLRREGMSARDVADLVARLIADHGPTLSEGAALSVRSHLVGVRKLPLIRVPPDDSPETD